MDHEYDVMCSIHWYQPSDISILSMQNIMSHSTDYNYLYIR